MKNMSSSFVPMVYDRTFEEWPSRAQPFELYLTFLAELSSTKGQIISKGLFGVLKFSQKTNEWIRRSSKNEFVRSFFGRIREHQTSFRDYLTFITWTHNIKHLEMYIFCLPCLNQFLNGAWYNISSFYLILKMSGVGWRTMGTVGTNCKSKLKFQIFLGTFTLQMFIFKL